MFTVYILRSDKTHRFYIGYTRNLEQRILFHNAGLNKSTKHGIPWKIVYTEKFETVHESTQRENFLKKQKNTAFYEKIINLKRSSDVPNRYDRIVI